MASGRLFPSEGPFAPDVEEWNDEDHREDDQLDQPQHLELAHKDGQRDDRRGLDIEDDKEHTSGEVFDRETRARRLDLLNARLVGSQLLRGWIFGAEDEGDENHQNRED